ncbi:MAG: 3-deoxy-7-phosphoheptulonate synthase [Limnochordia bacterium]|jgi:3-deoxy-7-phosphoheptulonate synthase
MIVVMKPDATQSQIAATEQKLKQLGFGYQTIVGEQRVVIGATGDQRDKVMSLALEWDGVEKVVPILQPYKLASREFRPESSVIKVKDVAIGNGELVVAAGPCAVETDEQMRKTAAAVKAAGGQILRGGAYKPRTSPYSFQGYGVAGLKMIKHAADDAGLLVITEVVEPNDVETVAEYTDIVQIGARNMQNYSLLKKVGKLHQPVMLKRGLASTIEEWLMAAEYILSEGNSDVILCERGIRTYETTTRNTLDLSAVPVLKALTHLPVFVDPSHGTGKRHLVPAMAKAAVAVGADGLLIEIHPNPAEALSDGPQSLELESFAMLMRQLGYLHRAVYEMEKIS